MQTRLEVFKTRRQQHSVLLKKYPSILILTLLAAGISLVALFSMPLTPSNLSEITVTNQAHSNAASYVLGEGEAQQLIDALQGTVAGTLPDNIEASYEITLNLRARFLRRYTVYVTSERDVYFQRSVGSRLIRSDNARFFYIHEAFHDLYSHGQIPDVRIVAEEEELFPQVQNRWWQFLKWDNNWYAGILPSLSDPGQLPVFTSAESHLAIESNHAPDRVHLHVTDPTGRIIFDDSLTSGELPLFARNGLLNYRVRLLWEDEEMAYRGEYDATFSVMMNMPPAFQVPGPTLVQGEMAAFYARHLPEGVRPVLMTDMVSRVQFFPYEDGYVAYLPTHYGTRLGDYQLAYGLEGGPLTETTITLMHRDFHIQHLRVDASIAASTRNDAAYEQFSRYFPKARETSADERYYTEPFVIPVLGRLTTEFGQTRYVNNAPTASRHSGLDIAAPSGTPIAATNRGRVTLSMDLILTGNTLVIDHGQGLFSVHFHMHELFVKEGQLVERGETVGTVGTTGFSTGPHLHFTMSYYSHNLEPGYFLVGEPITFANARRHLNP